MVSEEDILLGKALFDSGYLDKVRFERYQRMLTETQTQGSTEILVDSLGVAEDVVAEVISDVFQIPLVELTPEIITAPKDLFSDVLLQKYRMIPVLVSGVELTVAFVDPPQKTITDQLRQDVKMFIIPVAITLSSYKSIAETEESTFDEYKSLPSKLNIDLLDVSRKGREKYQELQKVGKLPSAETVFDEVLLRGVKEDAADIHFEPTSSELRVRFNNDGVMERIISFPKEMQEGIANVLRARAGMNVFEKKKPQDGRFSATYANHTFDFRVSSIPTIDGERVTIRLLRKSARVLNIHDLGFSQENLSKYQYLLRRPRGLVIIAGPSGSGKTTTLYAGINELRSSQKNIVTVENPVEYRLEFASQVQTDPENKMDFANALRAMLRHNPDIIMLGEIRDAETGTVAAEAALTGNYVLTTMLFGDAISTIPRLISLGIPPYYLAPSLDGVVYQQLVRRVCKYCREEFTPTRRMLTNAGLAQLEGLLALYRGKGCERCGGDGYLGRTAIHEVLIINESIRDLIYQQASLVRLKEVAQAKGFEVIRFDAAKKLISGVISLEEYLRALG